NCGRPGTAEAAIPLGWWILRLASPPLWLDAGAGVWASAGAITTRTATSTATIVNSAMSARRACDGGMRVLSLMLWSPELGRLPRRLIFGLVVRMDAGHEFAAQTTRGRLGCQWEMIPKRQESH